MSILLNLDSSRANTTTSHDFTLHIPEGIQLHENWSVALVSAQLWYSYVNISQAKGNNIFTYIDDTSTSYDIVVNDGMYNISDINDLLYAFQVDNEHDTAGVVPVSIEPNYNTSNVDITIAQASNFVVDLSTSLMYSLFGFSAAQAATPLDETTTGESIADISGGRSKILICTSLLEGSDSMWDNTTKGTALYSFSPDTPPGSLMTIEPSERIYLHMDNQSRIARIRMYILDNQGNVVDMRGENCTYMVHLKKL